MKSPLAFVHIPKCSGTAFERYLARCLGRMEAPTRCFCGVGPGGAAETLEEYFADTRESTLVSGHIFLRAMRSALPDALVVTFLRDPIARTISHYRYWHDPAHFNDSQPHARLASPQVREAWHFAQRASLEEFVTTQNPRIRPGAVGNIQTRMLSTCKDKGEDMEGHLESAKQNLESLCFFGITERFDASIDLFRRIFVDAPAYAVPTSAENRANIPMEPPSPEVIETIRSQVLYDIELYRFACDLFESRLQAPAAPPVRLAELVVPRSQPVVGAAANDFVRLKRENADLRTRLAASRARLADLRTRLAALSGRHARLADAHRAIKRSRTWRLVEGVQRLAGRLLGR